MLPLIHTKSENGYLLDSPTKRVGDRGNSQGHGMGHTASPQWKTQMCVLPRCTSYPEDGDIRVHQSRVKPCPVGFPAGFYWYKHHRAKGSVLSWVQEFLDKPPQVDLPHDQPEEDPLVPDFNDVVDDGHEPADQCEVNSDEPVQKRSIQGKYRLRKTVNPPTRLCFVATRDDWF